MAEHMRRQDEKEDVSLIRIYGKDIRGDKSVFAGLSKINGISWALSSAICKKLALPKKKTIQELSADEIKSVEEFISSPQVPSFMKNRQKDLDGGEDEHLSGPDLKLKKEFDVKRLRKIKSYRGIRHAAKLPVRGQRTRSNFRRNRRKSGATGIKNKK